LVDIRERGGPAASVVSELETGAVTKPPKIDTLRRLAHALGEPEADIFRAAGLLTLSAIPVGAYPVTPEEAAIISRAELAGLAFPSELLDRVPPGERRRLIRDLELFVDELERLSTRYT